MWLFLGQCVGVGIVTITSQIPILLGGLREHRKVHMHVLVGGMIIAIVCVSVSRAVGLSPWLLLRPHCGVRASAPHRSARLGTTARHCVGVRPRRQYCGVLSHRAGLSRGHVEPPVTLLLILDPALNVTFLGGFASLAFGMFPLPFLPGRHVRAWNKWAWMVITTVGLIGFVAVLLSPGSGSPSEVQHIALVPLIVAFGLFALGSLAFMAYFHLRPSPPSPTPPEPTVAATD
jgi:hypothetical protein